MTGDDVLGFDAVRYRWPRGDAPALTFPSWTLGHGQRIFVRGPSGSGKSTLLSLAAGVLLPDEGRVWLQGKEWRELGAAARDARRCDHIGYVFQQFNLLPYLDVMDNVLLPCRFSARRAQRAALGGSARASARALLEALELDASLHHRPAALLSVGQQQRVAAARALIGSPELVIADEPTSALDEALRDRFMDLLLRACEEQGSALVFVSHDARLATRFERAVTLDPASMASTVSTPALTPGQAVRGAVR